MSITPIISINKSPVIQEKKVIINTNGIFPAGPQGNIGPTGPTGPKGTDITIGETTIDIQAFDKAITTIANEQINIDNIEKYRQCIIRDLKVQVKPIQDFNGYGFAWSAGKGKNLYDKDTYPLTLNQYINRIDGTVGYNQDFAATDFIPIPNSLQIGDIITLSPLPQDLLPGLAFYDNMYRYISGSKGANTIIPENAFYLRFTVNNEYGDGNEVQLEKGDIATEWVPYSNICPFTRVDNVNLIYGDSTTTNTLQENFNNFGGFINYTQGIKQFGTYYEEYGGEELLGEWISNQDVYSPDVQPTLGAEVIDYGNIQSSSTFIPMLFILSNDINYFITSNGIIIAEYEENIQPRGTVSTSTDEDGVVDFNFNLSLPILEGTTGPAAGFGVPIVSISTLSPDEQATVSITSSGSNVEKIFNFHFNIPQGTTGPTGSITYATFDVDPTTGTLYQNTTDAYDGPIFDLDEDGNLGVNI